MPLNNCSITIEELSGTEGTVSGSGIVNLTITPELGYTIINSDGSIDAEIGGATEVNPNEWVGGNVTTGVEKVIFSNNGNNTVNVAVYYAAIDWSSATDLHIDIDGEASRLIVDSNDPTLEDDGTNSSTEDSSGRPTSGGNEEESCCDDFIMTGPWITHPSGADIPDGQITASAGYNCDDDVTNVLFEVRDLNGVIQNAFGLLPGDYVVTVHDLNEVCDPISQVVSLNAMASESYSVDSVIVGNRGFNNEIQPVANTQPIKIQHGSNAEFEVEIKDIGSGTWYSFSGMAWSTKRTVLTVKSNGKRITRETIHFPKVSATARYEIFINPLGRAKNKNLLAEKVPTKLDPLEIYQRVNSVVRVALTSSNTTNWGSFGSVTFTGRPHSKPSKKNENLVRLDFSITAAFSSGGGKGSAALRSGRSYVVGAISIPATEGTIVAYDSAPKRKFNTTPNKKLSGFVSNDLTFTKIKAVYSAPTLTITGAITVNQFGSLSETITIDLDNFMTLS
jgi:hypothetical protein